VIKEDHMSRHGGIYLLFAGLIGFVQGCDRKLAASAVNHSYAATAAEVVAPKGGGEQPNASDAPADDLAYQAKLKDWLSLGGRMDSFENRTPLVIAAANDYAESAKFLIAHGANVNICVEHMTPLSWAANRGHLELAKLLLQAGASVRLPNGDGDSVKTPFMSQL
jgi:hypothetical protein